jgi:hypothetical protein
MMEMFRVAVVNEPWRNQEHGRTLFRLTGFPTASRMLFFCAYIHFFSDYKNCQLFL